MFRFVVVLSFLNSQLKFSLISFLYVSHLTSSLIEKIIFIFLLTTNACMEELGISISCLNLEFSRFLMQDALMCSPMLL